MTVVGIKVPRSVVIHSGYVLTKTLNYQSGGEVKLMEYIVLTLILILLIIVTIKK